MLRGLCWRPRSSVACQLQQRRNELPQYSLLPLVSSGHLQSRIRATFSASTSQPRASSSGLPRRRLLRNHRSGWAISLHHQPGSQTLETAPALLHPQALLSVHLARYLKLHPSYSSPHQPRRPHAQSSRFYQTSDPSSPSAVCDNSNRIEALS
jgi:hypothetical protein